MWWSITLHLLHGLLSRFLFFVPPPGTVRVVPVSNFFAPPPHLSWAITSTLTLSTSLNITKFFFLPYQISLHFQAFQTVCQILVTQLQCKHFKHNYSILNSTFTPPLLHAAILKLVFPTHLQIAFHDISTTQGFQIKKKKVDWPLFIAPLSFVTLYFKVFFTSPPK